MQLGLDVALSLVGNHPQHVDREHGPLLRSSALPTSYRSFMTEPVMN
jgi:hypothetical protein